MVLAPVVYPVTWAMEAHDRARPYRCVKAGVRPGDLLQEGKDHFGTPRLIKVIAVVEKASSECPYAFAPNHARVAQVPTPPAPASTNVKISLPEGWDEMKLSYVERLRGVVVHAVNKPIDCTIWLRTVRRDSATDLDLYALARRAERIDRLTEPHVKRPSATEVENIVLGGRKASRFRVTGGGPYSGTYTIEQTFLQGEKEIAEVTTWCQQRTFRDNISALQRIPSRVVGL